MVEQTRDSYAVVLEQALRERNTLNGALSSVQAECSRLKGELEAAGWAYSNERVALLDAEKCIRACIEALTMTSKHPETINQSPLYLNFIGPTLRRIAESERKKD